jgi:formylmethanofuran dehydrogenase subunit E
MQNENELLSTINSARKLHGHLGPFLVLGVRMGMVAKKALDIADDRQASLMASVKVPLVPPFSCLLDGIQVSASCTIGNRRLTIENSEEICVTFAKQNDIGMVKIKLKPEMAKELEKRRSEDALTENFALELVRAPENRLFHVEIE